MIGLIGLIVMAAGVGGFAARRGRSAAWCLTVLIPAIVGGIASYAIIESHQHDATMSGFFSLPYTPP